MLLSHKNEDDDDHKQISIQAGGGVVGECQHVLRYILNSCQSIAPSFSCCCLPDNGHGGDDDMKPSKTLIYDIL